MSTVKETIKLKSYLDVQEERDAGEALYPGHLLEITSVGKFQKHSNAGQNVVQIFAIEDALQGKDIDDQYSSDDPVRGWIPQRGDHALTVLADGENVEIGDYLESAGNGTLQKHIVESTTYSNQIVGIAVEAMDLSGSAGAESSGTLDYPRNRLRILIL